MPRIAPVSRVRLMPTSVMCLVSLALIACAGCSTNSARSNAPSPSPTQRASSSQTPTQLPQPTATSESCAPSTVPGPSLPQSFPVPPQTVSVYTSGAAGAGFWIECTPSATPDSLAAFMNAALLQAGWIRWDPQTQNANGCGTEPNTFWQWVQGETAVGYNMTVIPMPRWSLAFCDLHFGH